MRNLQPFNEGIMHFFSRLKWIISIPGFCLKVTLGFMQRMKMPKTTISPDNCRDKGLQGTLGNRICQSKIKVKLLLHNLL